MLETVGCTGLSTPPTVRPLFLKHPRNRLQNLVYVRSNHLMFDLFPMLQPLQTAPC